MRPEVGADTGATRASSIHTVVCGQVLLNKTISSSTKQYLAASHPEPRRRGAGGGRRGWGGRERGGRAGGGGLRRQRCQGQRRQSEKGEETEEEKFGGVIERDARRSVAGQGRNGSPRLSRRMRAERHPQSRHRRHTRRGRGGAGRVGSRRCCSAAAFAHAGARADWRCGRRQHVGALGAVCRRASGVAATDAKESLGSVVA
jgi:hypothetical protein